MDCVVTISSVEIKSRPDYYLVRLFSSFVRLFSRDGGAWKALLLRDAIRVPSRQQIDKAPGYRRKVARTPFPYVVRRFYTISQVRIVSSARSSLTARPITMSAKTGEMPVPGRLGMRSSFLMTSPALMSRVSTSERRASRRGTISQGSTVFSGLPRMRSIQRKFATARAKSSGSPAW